MFALVRTDAHVKKQEGITFLLLDMAQTGVEVRPIKLISGSSPFCETFFTDARASRSRRYLPRGRAGRSPRRCSATSAT